LSSSAQTAITNNTVFQMQILLALQYMDEGLKTKIRLGQSLVEGKDCIEWLPYSWSGRTFDQENNPGSWANPDDNAPVLKRIEDYQGEERKHRTSILNNNKT